MTNPAGAIPPLVHRIVNVLVLVAVLWVNGMAGAGTISGESIGLIANRYQSYFLPANYVFAIWSLIYLALVAFAVFQAVPGARTRDAVQRLGWWWSVNGLLNMAWVVTFSFSLFGTALLIMILLLLSLIVIHERMGIGTRRYDWGTRLFVAYPFSLYLAWISVALIANTFQYVTYLQWGGWGISGPAWSAIMLVVATGLAAFMMVHRGNWWFPVVFGWAYVGIADRFVDVPLIAATAYLMTGGGVLALAAGGWYRHRRVA